MSNPAEWGATRVETPADWGAVSAEEPPQPADERPITFDPSLTFTPASSPEELSARNFYRQPIMAAAKTAGNAPSALALTKEFWGDVATPIPALAKWIQGVPAKTLAEAVDVLKADIGEAFTHPFSTQAEHDARVQARLGEAAARGPSGLEKGIAGTQQAVAETVQSFTSPLGLSTLGLGALPKVAQRIVAGAFATHMASTLPAQAKAAVESIKAGDTEGAAKHISSTALTAGFVGVAGKHALVAEKAPAVADIRMEAAKAVGPVTEAAVTRQTILEAPKAELEAPAAPIGLGAATPAEFELGQKNATSIKNAVVDQERAKRGLPPVMEPAAREFGTVWETAMERIDADPLYTDWLLASLKEKPRALTDVENAALLHRQIELQNEHTKAMRDLAQAKDDGRLEDAELENVRVAGLSDRLLNLYETGKSAGTETARGLNARKMLAFEDFSLAKMELEKRAAKGGEQLTEAERAAVMEANKRIEAAEKAFDEHAAGAEDRARNRETTRAITEAGKAKEPVEPLEEITSAMRDKFAAGESDAFSSLVQKLARQFVARGIKEREPLIEAVHNIVKDIDPTLTIRDTMDAISGYGRFRRLSEDEISVKLRDLKGQMQQVAKLEDMEANRPPLKTGTEKRIPSDEERRLIQLVNEAKNKFQIPITDEATQLKSSLDTLKTKLRNQIVDFERRLLEKDFEKKPKRFIQMDKKAQELHFEAAKAKAKWHEALMKDRLARRSLPAKLIGGIGEMANTIRAVLTSGEFSGVLRQGGFVGIGNPARAAKAFPAMIKALRSEARQHAVELEIMSRENYPIYLRAKLFLSEHGQKLSQQEEAYMSRWAGKIPVVAGTQRAYSTFLNKLRADSFDALAATLVRRTGKELTPERARDIANYVNVATGRGSLGVKHDAALVTLNTAFFAPRWVASRFQLLLGQPLWRPIARRDWAMTRLVAEEYSKFLIGMGVIYGLSQMAGAEVEWDPRSSDFGKLRFGDTRVDLMAGLQQQTVLLSRLGTGETKRLSGKVVPIRGKDVPFGAPTSANVAGRFLRTKLAPIPGSALDVTTGSDVVGQPVTLSSELMEMSVPLTYKDIYKVMIDQGVPAGTALALLAVFGAGVQTYE